MDIDIDGGPIRSGGGGGIDSGRAKAVVWEEGGCGGGNGEGEVGT